MAQFFYNIRTQQVEEGRQSDWSDLMGPYPTRAEAQRALETARENTERWDEEERRWKDGDED